MAVLKKSVTTAWSFFELPEGVPPKGTFVATCIDIEDRFDVERKKFQSEEMERCDLTQFLFGFRDKQGNPHKIASRVMKISMNEKSSLYGWLRSWTGEAPKEGWDYVELKNTKAMITVDHEARKTGDGSYATIVSIMPVPEGVAEPAPSTRAAQPQPAKKAATRAAPVVETSDEEMPF